MRKEAAEMKVFTEFAMAANLHVDSGTLPDIRCSISGEDCLFELGEVTDEALTGEIGRSLRMGAEGDGGVRKRNLSSG